MYLKSFTAKEQCTGCGLCSAICPEKAVTMTPDEQGCPYPSIDADLCSECGACVDACPATASQPESRELPLPYVGWAKDFAVRRGSTSGGLFPLFAGLCLERGGLVCGAAFSADYKSVVHDCADQAKDSRRFCGSKYLESSAADVYCRVKDALDGGRPVLFSGVPCQVAGLKSFLGKEYDALLTIDLICHGVPPQSLWQRYLADWEALGLTPVEVQFREKTRGWLAAEFCISMRACSGNILQYRTGFVKDPYVSAFLHNMTIRPSCTACRYKHYVRQADITLADFWGIERFRPDIGHKDGVSLVLVNSPAGRKALENVRPLMGLCEQVPWDWPHMINSELFGPAKVNPQRQVFLSRLAGNRSLDFSLALGKALKPRRGNKVGIIPWIGRNYGNFMQNYALLQALTALGYEASCLEARPWIYDDAHAYLRPRDEAFLYAEKHLLRRTKGAGSLEEVHAWNDEFDAFVVGSDQVWSVKTSKYINMTKFLWGGYVNPDKRLISYAASMGMNFFSGDYRMLKLAQSLIRKFDRVSLREKSGTDICRRLFGVEATHVLDPTLLLTEDDYRPLLDAPLLEEAPPEGQVALYAPYTPEKLIEDISRKLWDRHGLKVINAASCLRDGVIVRRSMPGFLHCIRNSAFVISDSFHCTVFSVIFRKPFIFFSHGQEHGAERLISLAGHLDLPPERFQSAFTYEAVARSFDMPPPDYDRIYEVLSRRREESLRFLRESLA